MKSPGEKRPGKPAKERPKDLAYEEFAEILEQETGIAIDREDRSGFVWLARLRKRLAIGTHATPEGWSKALDNYFRSDNVTKHTLAHLCRDYEVFLVGPLDRFGKRPEKGNHETSKGNRARASAADSKTQQQLPERPSKLVRL